MCQNCARALSSPLSFFSPQPFQSVQFIGGEKTSKERKFFLLEGSLDKGQRRNFFLLSLSFSPSPSLFLSLSSPSLLCLSLRLSLSFSLSLLLSLSLSLSLSLLPLSFFLSGKSRKIVTIFEHREAL